MKKIAILTLCALMSVSLVAQTVDNKSIIIQCDSTGVNMSQGAKLNTEIELYQELNSSEPNENDSIEAEQLKEVIVEAKYSTLGAQVSTYIPTSTQKNAAINATDLLNRMAIPQLQISLGDAVTTIAGKPVNIFIDYMPAAKEDLTAMKMTDVKRVEYYDYPADPRFEGKAHVVNFIMQQYHYGGYVKPYLERCLGARTAQWALFNRVQYKRMTFDFALDGFYKEQNKVGSDLNETFRLPQQDGSVNVIEKHSYINTGGLQQRDHYAYFKTKYKTDKFNMQHNVMLNLKRRPRYDQSGRVSYSDPTYNATTYDSESSSKASSIEYSGYIFYQFNDNNSFVIDPQYIYSHTNTSSLYYEQISQKFYNGARDTTHEYMLPFDYDHYFGQWGQLHVHFLNYYSSSNTEYFGTAQSKDHSEQLDFTAGARYILSKGKFYGFIGAGYYWDRTQYGSIKVKSHSPWADLSLQYSPNDKQSALIEYHHMSSSPSPNYFSENVILKDPLMSYTGNPKLTPYHCHDLTISYNFVPNNHYSISAYGYMFKVNNRYVEDYVASPTGIIRKVVQGIGDYQSFDYGLRATARYLENKLQLTASLYGSTWQNGAPYDQNQTKFFYYLQANYYVGKWNLGALFYSRRTYADGFTNSQVITTKPTYYLSAGWSNSIWNIKCTVYDFAKWNYRSSVTTMHSQAYNYVSQAFSQADHFFVKLTATYVFSFGKKVERGNDSIQKTSVISGILK